MGLVSSLFMKLNAVSMANNAEASWMNSANQIMQGVSQVNPNLSFGAVKNLHDRENNLQAKMHMADFQRQVADAQLESSKKMLKDNIKRSFDMYA